MEQTQKAGICLTFWVRPHFGTKKLPEVLLRAVS
jgi:hypothetical protein